MTSPSTVPSTPLDRRYRFGPWLAEPSEGRLWRGDEAVTLEPKAAAVLSLLLARAGHLVEKSTLLDRAWPEVHVGENSLARAVAQLRRALDDDPRQPRFIETVHGRGYRFVAAVVIESMASATTPSGPALPASAVSSADAAPDGDATTIAANARIRFLRSRLVLGLALLAVFALGVLAVARLWAPRTTTGASSGASISTDTQAPLDAKRIAVLPWVDLGAGDDYLAHGITEQLISGLARVDGLRVVPRTSVMTFERANQRAGEIGRTLRAGSLLEGSVRRTGDQLSLTVQLIDANHDEILWSKDYTFGGDALFATQAEIVLRVAESLRVAQVGPLDPLGPTDSFTALDHYLRGREGYRQQTRVGNEVAVAQYALALERDNDFAQAWAGQANAFAMRTIRYGDDDAWIDRAEASARRALALTPTLAEAHKALGLIADSRYHLDAALDAYARAVELDPIYEEALYNAGTVAFELGRWDEAIAWQLRDVRRPLGRGALAIYLYELGLDEEADAIANGVLQHDPLTGYLNRFLAARAVRLGEYDDAATRLEALQRAYPNWSRVWMTTGDLAWRLGQRDEAMRRYQQAAGLTEDVDPEIDLRLAIAGDPADADAALARVRSSLDALRDGGSEWHQHAYLWAAVSALAGRIGDALNYYETALTRGRRAVHWDLDDPALASLVVDPRFEAAIDAIHADLEAQRARVRAQHGSALRRLARQP